MFDRFLGSRTRDSQIEAAINVDFTGGLVDRGTLQPVVETDSVRDVLNMDFLPGGGIRRRYPITMLYHFDQVPSVAGQDFQLVRYEQSDRVSYFIHLVESGVGNSLWELEMTSTPTITEHGTATLGTANSSELAGFQAGGLVYLNRYPRDWYTYDGTTFTQITSQALNTGTVNFATYSQTGIPTARQGLMWDGRIWLARPTDPGGEQDNQVSFSWPFGDAANEGPQDFHVDLAYRFQAFGHEGDRIIRMAPHAGGLYVFTRRSVFRLDRYFGEPSTLYYTNRQVTDRVGAAGPHAVAIGDASLWFYDAEEGLMEITQEGKIVSHMEKVRGVMDDLESTELNHVVVSVVNDRVWVSLPESGETYNTMTLVYDPRIGAWTKYDIGFVEIWEHIPVGDSGEYPATYLGICFAPDTGYATLVELENGLNEQADVPYDYLSDTVGLEYYEIDTYINTAWFDADFPEQVKDWRGVEFFFSTWPDQTMCITSYTDYDGAFDAAYWEVEAENPAVYEGSVPSYTDYFETSAQDAVTTEVNFGTTTTFDRTDNAYWTDSSERFAVGNTVTLTGTNAGNHIITAVSGDTITCGASTFTLTTETATVTPLSPRRPDPRLDETEYPFGVSAVGVTSATPLPEPVRVRRSLQGRAVSFRVEPKQEAVPSPYTGSAKKYWALNRFTVFFSRKGLRA